MASLYWRATSYTLGPANENIGEIEQAINSDLPKHGYTNVQGTGGGKGNFFVAVMYLYISDRNFWQVIGCGGLETGQRLRST